MVSGHAHGGQVRIPGVLNGLYAPNQGWFPKLAGGAYAQGGTTLIVSRGLAVRTRLPRNTVEWIIRAVSFRFENYNYAELCIHYNANQKK